MAPAFNKQFQVNILTVIEKRKSGKILQNCFSILTVDIIFH